MLVDLVMFLVLVLERIFDADESREMEASKLTSDIVRMLSICQSDVQLKSKPYRYLGNGIES